jgi:hypothetical protein
LTTYVQQLKDLENILHRVYLKIYTEIKKDDDYPNNLSGLKKTYNTLVYDNTRAVIQSAVILGSEKVNRLFKTEPYLTQSDLDLIKKNSDMQTDSFWRKIQLDINRKHEQKMLGGAVSEFDEEGNLIPPPDLDMTAYLLAVSIASLFGSFADSTLSKTTELGDTIEATPKVRWRTVQDEKTCDTLPDGSIGCAARDGTIYEVNDPELEVYMPGSVHPYCRCTLEPII